MHPIGAHLSILSKTLLLFLLPILSIWLIAADSGNLRGTITDSSTNQPLSQVTIELKNRLFERTVTVDERFQLTQIPVGDYRLKVSVSGFSTLKRDITINTDQTTELTLQLQPQPLTLRDVVVAPSTFSLLSEPAVSNTYLDRETIRNTPHFGDDVYRALGALPGTSSTDFSASFNVRGGEYREVQVSLDGMELINPFHLKDYTGVFSILDPEALGGLTLATGGYSAKYGNAMSGVMEMRSVDPTERRTSASVSFGNVSFRTEGTFSGGLGTYYFSGRRGYLDILLGFTEDEEEEEESDITYYDSYGKLTYVLGSRHNWSINYLLANDSFLSKENEDGEIENADSSYDDFYFWSRLNSAWTDRLSSETVLYHTRIDQDRLASSFGGAEDYDFFDNRSLRRTGVRQNWEFSLNAGNFLRWGVEAADVKAEYDYQGITEVDVPIGNDGSSFVDTYLEPEGKEYAAYLTNRFKLSEKWYGELGVRYDRQTLLRDSQVSPRLNMYWKIDPSTSVRFAYGTYHQPERAHELQVADGVREFSLPEKTTQYLLGFDHRFRNGLDFRLEGYYKDLEDPRIRFENLTRSMVQYPGLSADRVALPVDSGEVTGVELVLKQNSGERFSWFLNYAWSKAEDRLGDETISRQWDQEHTLNLSANYRPGPKWNFNAAWIYHTGWRTTPVTLASDGEGGFELVPGDFFSDTFPAYHRLDLRINRRVQTANRRSFELFLDVSNLYNRKNVRGYQDWQIVDDGTGNPVATYETEEWLPVLPTFGLTWTF